MDLLKSLCSLGLQCPVTDVCQEIPQCKVKPALKTSLQRYFKHDDFRPGHLAATLAASHGRDVFVRMATGAGKSLCLFLVPLAAGTTAMGIIISPLVGLMDQQVGVLMAMATNYCVKCTMV